MLDITAHCSLFYNMCVGSQILSAIMLYCIGVFKGESGKNGKR